MIEFQHLKSARIFIDSYQYYSPADASRIVTAPSSTRNDRSTSIVKSTCPIEKYKIILSFSLSLTHLYTRNVPGVSMRLIRCLFHGIVIDADVIVIPLSRS
jgi:hypothetical protein